MSSGTPVDVFFAYSHKDEALRDELEAHLAVLKRTGVIRGWHDHAVSAGEDSQDVIDAHFDQARVVLLLVSADFLASDYCYDTEVKRALERRAAGQAIVLPIILRECDWKDALFAGLPSLPKNGPAVTSWSNRDEAWKNVALGIRAEVDRPARVFISYKRGAVPDERLARAVAVALEGKNHRVFLDQVIAPGTLWAARIEQEIAESDWLVLLLSEASVHSEMVRAELESARRCLASAGKPRLLPVRVAYRDPLPYPLSAYLDGIQWAFWDAGMDPGAVAAQIAMALAGKDLPLPPAGALHSEEILGPISAPTASAQPLAGARRPSPRKLERPEEPVHPESRLYVERATDREAHGALAGDHAATVTIKGSRQMGKTALLNRLALAARGAGKRVAYVDFKLFDSAALTDERRFFEQFTELCADELGVACEREAYWSRFSAPKACTKHVIEKLLRPLGAPVLLAADELERLFDSPVRHPFFGMLRSWHESRVQRPELARLDMVLVTSTDPERFTRDDTTYGSPFNVGTPIVLEDFSAAEIDALIEKHDLTLEVEQRRVLRQLFGGHPYLVRRALFLIATERWAPEATTTAEEIADPFGPFGDHLRQYVLQLQGAPELARELHRALQGSACSSPTAFERLRGAGLLRGSRARPEPRCELYAVFFRKQLDV